MSSFTPSPAESALVSQIFSKADPGNLGIVKGEAAVNAFAGSGLSPTVLGDIWSMADKENNGFLTRRGVGIAVRLIGHAQEGEKVKESLIDQPGPLPRIDGLGPSTTGLPLTSSSPPPRSPAHTSLPASLPPLTPQDKTKFLRIFANSGPENGLLSGDKARDIFIKSQLPVEKLSQIWTLADAHDRGLLDQTEFTIAMYLIQATMAGQLPVIPTKIPPRLYEQAGGRPPQAVATHGTGNSPASSPSLTGSFPTPAAGSGSYARATPLVAQHSGQAQAFRTNPPLPSRPPVSVALTGTAVGSVAFGTKHQHWDITPVEKANFDKFFDSLDTLKKGFIEGEVAVPFMVQSNLPGDVLAQIWDLADLNNDGKLTRDGFAVAMHLIHGKISGKPIPPVLPESLVPPSLRRGRPPLATVPEPVNDLLWDDSPPASATGSQFPVPGVAPSNWTSDVGGASPALHQQVTGHLSHQRTGGFASTSPSSLPAFVPATSPFGRTAASLSVHKDLLSDDEDGSVTAASVPDHSAEIGNLQIQVNSTTRSLNSTKAERESLETTLTSQAGQLSALQTQLSSAKAAYETETRLLASLRERHSTQTADIQKTKEELIRAESDLSAIRVEKAEVEGGLLRDKEEVRELHRKMKEVGEEIEDTKAATEKAKKDAKQQKGLLAIAKKQLATREAEKAKAEKELAEAEKEVQEATKEHEAIAEALAQEYASSQTNGIPSPRPASPTRADTPAFAATMPLPSSPSLTSLASATTSPTDKSNNPFARLVQSSATSSPHVASPFHPFEDAFPPVTAVSSQNTSSPFYPIVPANGHSDANATPALVNDASRHVFEDKFPSLTIPDKSTEEDPFGFPEVAQNSFTASPSATTPDKSIASLPPHPGQSAAESSWPILGDETGSISAPAAELAKHEQGASVSEASDNVKDNEDAAKPVSSSPLAKSAVRSSAFGFDDDDEHDRHDDPLEIKLKEIEHDDSDSDGDEVFQDANGRLSEENPLNAPEDKQTSPDNNIRSSDKAVSPPPVIATPSIFSDPFVPAVAEEQKASERRSQQIGDHSLFDIFIPSQPSQSSDKEMQNGEPISLDGGLKDFDDAFGKLPASSDTNQVRPHFNAFDDNFDFSTASADVGPIPLNDVAKSAPTHDDPTPVGPPPSSPLPALNGTPAIGQAPATTKAPSFTTPAVTAPSEFDASSISALPNPFALNGSPAPMQSKVEAGDHGITFEQAFGENGPSKALALDAFGVGSTGQPTNQAHSKQASAVASGSTPFPLASVPSSPTARPVSPAAVRSPSPHQSPPTNRVASPKPRYSTGSSNEGHSPAKPAPQTRHSKISLRLPFGRKKKRTDPEVPQLPSQPSSSFLTPVAEPNVTQTPPADDDVPPVKQLCGMGFSRTQAVAALEQHGYDVQKALNSLLGSP